MSVLDSLLTELSTTPSHESWRKFTEAVSENGGLSQAAADEFGAVFDSWPQALWRLCPHSWVGSALAEGGNVDFERALGLCNLVEIFHYNHGFGPTESEEQVAVLKNGGPVQVCNALITTLLGLPFTRLRALSLGGEIDELGLRTLADAPLLSRIQHLELGVDTSDVGAFLSGAFVESLKSLSLFFPPMDSPRGLEALHGRALSLENLGLSNAHDENQLTAAAEAIPGLKRLAFRSGDSSLEAIARWKDSLEWLQLSSTYGAKDLKPIVSVGPWKHLSRVDLGFNNITGPTLKAMGKNMPELEHLYLDRDTDFGRTKVDAKLIAVLAQEQFAGLKGLTFNSLQVPSKDRAAVEETVSSSTHLKRALSAFRACSGLRGNWWASERHNISVDDLDGASLAPYDDFVVPLRAFRRELRHVVSAHYWLLEPDEDGFRPATP